MIKEQNASLQIHVLHLQEEINETQGKIRKVRDMIKLYGQVLQEMTARYSNIRKSEEPNPLSGRSLRTKEEEYDLLKVSHKTKYSSLKLNTKKKNVETNPRCSSSIQEGTTIDYFFMVRSCST